MPDLIRTYSNQLCFRLYSCHLNHGTRSTHTSYKAPFIDLLLLCVRHFKLLISRLIRLLLLLLLLLLSRSSADFSPKEHGSVIVIGFAFNKFGVLE